MITASALHLLALSACFVVQFGAPEVSRVQGVRRAIQTMESARVAASSQLDKAAEVRFHCLTLDILALKASSGFNPADRNFIGQH